MTFLNGQQALLAAAALIPAVLLLYFLKLRRRPVRVSSALFWPKASGDSQANSPFRWPRPSWLLALHLLLAATLLLAFARPVSEGGPGDRRLVILIDRSASMSARDVPGGPTRLERARQEAIRMVDRAGRSATPRDIAVIAFAHEAEALTAFTSSRGALRSAIDSIKPTDQPGNLGAALRLAETLARPDGPAEPASETEEPAAQAAVVLLGDGSYADQSGPAPLAVRFERIGPGENQPRPFNAGILTIGALRDEVDPAVVRVLVTIATTGEPAAPLPLVLLLNGEVVERRAYTPPAAAGDDARRFAAVGSTTFRALCPAGGVLTVALAGEDALGADNAASVVMRRPAAPVIWLVEPAPENAAPDAPPSPDSAATLLLTDVMRELRPRAFEVLSGAEYARRAAAGTIGADLVVFDRVAPAAFPACPTISIGVWPDVEGVRSEPAAPETLPVILWDRAHPVLRDVSLDTLLINSAAPLDISTRNATPIAHVADGPVMVVVRDGRHERLLLSFTLARSNWPLQASFPVFLANAVEHLTLRAGGASGLAFRTTEPVSIETPRGVREVELNGPMRAVAAPRTAMDTEAGRAVAGVIPLAGLYTPRPALEDTPAVAVNLTDAEESALLSPEQPTAAGAPLPGSQAGGEDREWWPMLVALAMLLLCVEWAVYAARTRA